MKVIRKHLPSRPEKVKLANRLRGRPTNSEIRMRKLLRGLKLRFCFQFPIAGYVADFIFVDRKLIVEVDGSSHNGRAEYDQQRDANLLRYGYRTVRIRADRINAERGVVLAEVEKAFWDSEKCFEVAPFQYSKMDSAI